MSLIFPNPCRSFDQNKNRICFWGYDRSIEVSFFVEADALKFLCPKIIDVEAGFLIAFDSVRERIHEIANKIYVRDGKGSYAYILAAKDF